LHYAVWTPAKKWNMLGCEELLKKYAEKQTAANPQNKAPQSSNPAPGTTEDKHDVRAYGLAGLLVLFLSGGAFALLWRTRKTMPRVL